MQTEGYRTLGENINKADTNSSSEGVSELTPELSLDMKDEELIALSKQWTEKWTAYSGVIEKRQTENENYWLGNQFESKPGVKNEQTADNLIFESIETALPIMTRPKADPMVESDNTDEGNSLADKVRKMLAYTADRISYNLKLKQIARFWSLYYLGVIKVGWSVQNNDIDCSVIRPQKLILDPEAAINEGEYNGYYIGEKLDGLASDLISRFPKQKEFITEKVKGKMGTKIPYIVWSTDDYIFWTLENTVLDKIKNPHWNYPTQEPVPVNEMGSQTLGADGQPVTEEKKGNNHFNHPKKPYVFLSIFNLGKHPHDDTSLISQNMPLQDMINKRLQQIDKNADNANAGLIVSGDAFTEEQANKAVKALRKGGVVWVPTGDVNNSVKRDVGGTLPPFIYQTLSDYRGELSDIFGVRGSSPRGLGSQKTVRGMQMLKSADQDRIGGGIAAYLEEFSDLVFNWFVQLMYVYYDEPHSASILGKEKAQEYITLVNTEFTSKLLVGVKEGSMVPHDPVDKRNEAIQLWGQRAIDPITFFDRLEFPNPKESAKQLYLWLSDPVQLFPDLAQQQAQKQPEGKPPSESINFKDLPPDGQMQMAAKAGIQLHPEGVMSSSSMGSSMGSGVPLPADYHQLMTQ